MRIIIVFSFEGQIVASIKKQPTHTYAADVSHAHFGRQLLLVGFVLLCSGANFHWFAFANVCGCLFICPFIQMCVDHTALFNDVVVQRHARTCIARRCVLHAWNAGQLIVYTLGRTIHDSGSHFIYRMKKLFSFLRRMYWCDEMKCLFGVGLTKVMVWYRVRCFISNAIV